MLLHRSGFFIYKISLQPYPVLIIFEIDKQKRNKMSRPLQIADLRRDQYMVIAILYLFPFVKMVGIQEFIRMRYGIFPEYASLLYIELDDKYDRKTSIPQLIITLAKADGMTRTEIIAFPIVSSSISSYPCKILPKTDEIIGIQNSLLPKRKKKSLKRVKVA